MSGYVDRNGKPLDVGDLVMRVNLRNNVWGHLEGSFFVVKELRRNSEGDKVCTHERTLSKCGTFGSDNTLCSFVIKIQKLDDDEILENNMLFSATTDNWERITDYPTKPKLEPELEPSKV